MNFFAVRWQDFAAMGTVASLGFGGFVWLMTQIMRRNFASHQDHEKLAKHITGVENRLGGVEDRLGFSATKTDITNLENRVRPVETGIAVLSEQVKSVQQGVGRTEHMVGILIEHQMKKEGAE